MAAAPLRMAAVPFVAAPVEPAAGTMLAGGDSGGGGRACLLSWRFFPEALPDLFAWEDGCVVVVRTDNAEGLSELSSAAGALAPALLPRSVSDELVERTVRSSLAFNTPPLLATPAVEIDATSTLACDSVKGRFVLSSFVATCQKIFWIVPMQGDRTEYTRT